MNKWYHPTTDEELAKQEEWFRKTLTELQKSRDKPRMIEGHLQQKFVHYIIRNVYGFWSWDIDQVTAISTFRLTSMLSIVREGNVKTGWFYREISEPVYKSLPLYLVEFEPFYHDTDGGWSWFKIYDKDEKLIHELTREEFKEWIAKIAQGVKK